MLLLLVLLSDTASSEIYSSLVDKFFRLILNLLAAVGDFMKPAGKVLAMEALEW